MRYQLLRKICLALSFGLLLVVPLAEIHPDSAACVGVRDGATVAVMSPHGRVVLEARVTDRVHPGCVVVPAGWSGANANLLTDENHLDRVTGFPGFRSGVCRVEPHAGPEETAEGTNSTRGRPRARLREP